MDVGIAPRSGPRVWRSWTIVLPAVTAGTLAVLLGTVGWLGTGLGVGSNCTDKFDCTVDTCAPCAAMSRWVISGGVGQWVLAAVACALLALGLRRASWRRAAALTCWFLIPLALLWIILTTVLAEHSF